MGGSLSLCWGSPTAPQHTEEAALWVLKSTRAAPASPAHTSGPSMAAGSVMVSMTSFTSSMGMSPMTRIRLASSSVRLSGSFRFSPGMGAERHIQCREGPRTVPALWRGLM